MQEACGRQLCVENASSLAVRLLLSLMYTGSLPMDLEPQSATVLEARAGHEHKV